jgi:signal transduction histidine kinase
MAAGGKEAARSSEPRSAKLISRPSAPDSPDAPRDHEHDADFLRRLTQELRTNLQAMLGFTQLMQRDQKQPLPERQRERARQVIDAGDRLLHMLDGAGLLSRLRAGEVAMTTQAVDVHRVFERVRTELEPAAVSRKLELAVGSSLVPRPLVLADAWGLTEILLKFVANAIIYNKPHGSVTLQVSPIAPAQLRISVIDTGIGIPFEEQHKLFLPFPRLARPIPSPEGAGLALAACRHLAVLMGGSVGCRSVPDQGSEFWVDLPMPSGGGTASLTPAL